jgi:hypothetical protein
MAEANLREARLTVNFKQESSVNKEEVFSSKKPAT